MPKAVVPIAFVSAVIVAVAMTVAAASAAVALLLLRVLLWLRDCGCCGFAVWPWLWLCGGFRAFGIDLEKQGFGTSGSITVKTFRIVG